MLLVEWLTSAVVIGRWTPGASCSENTTISMHVLQVDGSRFFIGADRRASVIRVQLRYQWQACLHRRIVIRSPHIVYKHGQAASFGAHGLRQ